MMSRRTYIVFAVSAIVLLALAGTFYYRYELRSTENDFNAQVSRALLSAQQLDFSSSIDQYQSLLQHATNKDDEILLKIGLGETQILSGDYQQGIPVLKQVIADPASSPEIRTLSIAFMANAYYLARKFEVLQFIFNDGGIYAEALAGADTNSPKELEQALNRLYLIADNWHQISFLQYTMAFQASVDLLDNQELSKTDQAKDLQIIKDRIAMGDKLGAQEIAQQNYTSSLYFQLELLGQHFRFFDMTVLARLDSSYDQQVSDDYAALMNLYQQYAENSPTVLMIENYTRFYYAAYLSEQFGTKKKQQIRDVIAPTIVTEGVQGRINELSVWPFYENELTRPKNERNHNERFILSIAKYDPDFDAFLVSKGWVEK